MTTLCVVCQRNPERMNSRIAQCSHVECPHRKPVQFEFVMVSPADKSLLDWLNEPSPEKQAPADKGEKREAKCRNCGSTDVRWRQQGGRWVLFSMQPGFEHRCGMDEIAKDFD